LVDPLSLLRFSAGTGHIWLDEQRMLLLHARALAALRKELFDSLGVERARKSRRLTSASSAPPMSILRKQRPPLPAQHLSHHDPGAARSQGRYPRARHALRGEVGRAVIERAVLLAEEGSEAGSALAPVEGGAGLDVVDRGGGAVGALVYTLADLAVFPYVSLAREGGYDMDSFPAIGRWVERVRAQPRFVGLFEPGTAMPAGRPGAAGGHPGALP